MTSLGNVEATPLASLTFVSFTKGDILYLTGSTQNLYGAEARAIMPFQDTLTKIFVTGYTYVRDALPLRQRAGIEIQPSPYSPPIKLLAAETPQSNIFSKNEEPSALLVHIEIHSPTLATFTWESSAKLSIQPGQAIILNLSTLFGSREYRHMAPGRPSLVNDDFIRTWTVSSSTEHDSDSRLFSLTIREKSGGTVTTALFNIIRKLLEYKPEALEDSRALGITVDVVGITGDFRLRIPDANVDVPRTLFWISGGIGITPFLSMLTALTYKPSVPTLDITLVVSTREPQVILSLIASSLGSANPHVRLFVHVFTHVTSGIQSKLPFVLHPGRLEPSFFESQLAKFEAATTEVSLCGPEPFEQVVLDYLNRVGIEEKSVQRERFSY
jgi:NAD(P)H-flavin reductase